MQLHEEHPQYGFAAHKGYCDARASRGAARARRLPRTTGAASRRCARRSDDVAACLARTLVARRRIDRLHRDVRCRCHHLARQPAAGEAAQAGCATGAATARRARSGSRAITCAGAAAQRGAASRRRCSTERRWHDAALRDWRRRAARVGRAAAGAVRRTEHARIAGADRLSDACRRRADDRRRRRRASCSTACRTPATSAASCAAPPRSASRRCSRSRARRRCGRRRCCVPAWARISGCGWSKASRVAALDALAVPLVAHQLARAASRCTGADLPAPCAWVFGHEGQGIVGDAAASAARLAVRIPQPGGEESLNVAAAAAICLYESVRRVRAHPGDAGPSKALAPPAADAARWRSGGAQYISRSGRMSRRIVVAISSIDLVRRRQPARCRRAASWPRPRAPRSGSCRAPRTCCSAGARCGSRPAARGRSSGRSILP